MRHLAIAFALVVAGLALAQTGNPFDGFTKLPALKGFYELPHPDLPSWERGGGPDKREILIAKDLRTADLVITVWAAKFSSRSDIDAARKFRIATTQVAEKPLRDDQLKAHGIALITCGGCIGSEFIEGNTIAFVEIGGYRPKDKAHPFWDVRSDPRAMKIARSVLVDVQRRVRLVK